MTDRYDQHLKRLDHLQAIILRVAGNSFLVKGWAVTLVSAALGFALKDVTTSSLAYLAMLPVALFWGLDAYYLAVERNIRTQYNDATVALQDALAGVPAAVLPDARITVADVGFWDWWNSAFTAATWVIYLLLMVCTVAVASGMFLRAAKAIAVYV